MTARACSREDCEVREKGKCVEGFDPLSECPYLASGEATDVDTPDKKTFIALPSGDALTEEQASMVTREAQTKVIVLAGPHKSGKTTILASLFDSFLEAPVANFIFAGSRTLVGFEKRCHDAREDSGRREAETPHTRVSETVDFLHLKLVEGFALSNRRSLLLSDISGERFRALRDSRDAVLRMPMLRRADYFAMVVDGEKLASPDSRHAARSDARTLLRSVLEANALAPSCSLQLVFTKWDAIKALGDDRAVQEFIGDTKHTIQQVAGERPVAVFEVAARPRNRSMRFAFGLPTLLRSWMEERAPERPTLYLPAEQPTARQFAQFAVSVALVQRFEEQYDVSRV